MSKQAEEMAAHLIEQLQKGGQGFEHRVNEEFFGKDKAIHYLIGNPGIILLADPGYTNARYHAKRVPNHPLMFRDTLKGIRTTAQNTEGKQMTAVFYGDGKHYMRRPVDKESGLKNILYKSLQELSLKNYIPSDVKEMIFLSPPEEAMASANVEMLGNNFINTYFHPEEGKIISHKLGKVKPDYTHMSDEDKRKVKAMMNKFYEHLYRPTGTYVTDDSSGVVLHLNKLLGRANHKEGYRVLDAKGSFLL